MKMKEKYIKRSCGLLAITMCLSVILSCFCGCYKSGPKFYDFRANWIYEGDDMTFTITTRGDSSYSFITGNIVINDKKIDIVIVAFDSLANITVYRSDEIDIDDENWFIDEKNDNAMLFDCNYKGYKKELVLSRFAKRLSNGDFEYYDDMKIVLKRYDY